MRANCRKDVPRKPQNLGIWIEELCILAPRMIAKLAFYLQRVRLTSAAILQVEFWKAVSVLRRQSEEITLSSHRVPSTVDPIACMQGHQKARMHQCPCTRARRSRIEVVSGIDSKPHTWLGAQPKSSGLILYQ